MLLSRRRTKLALALLLCVAIIGFPDLCSSESRAAREHANPTLFSFPYSGRGDSPLSFHQPYQPDPDGDPVKGWIQLGTAIIASDEHGRDIVRLTTTSQGNQGLLYAYTRTPTNNFNGFFDVRIQSSPDSHEAADGMAFFFTNSKPFVGSAMGISHTLPGLGIVIDTFSNSRTRRVPYVYAYVSDGQKEWNPNTDGSDTELTKGCHIDMNRVVRIYVQYVDEELSVGILDNPSHSNRWHMCFKKPNVKLPFNDGGYMAFAAETGHFFASHDVINAAFLYEKVPGADLPSQDAYGYSSQSRVHQEEPQYAERHVEQRGSNVGDEHREESTQARDRGGSQGRQQDERYRGPDAVSSLAGNLDRQVSEVFNSLSEHMRGYTDRDSEDTKQRLHGVKEMTSHLLQEVNRQSEEVSEFLQVLQHLRGTAGDLRYSADRFSTQMQSMQRSIRSLKNQANDLHTSHVELHEEVSEHHFALSKDSEGGSGLMFMFIMIQVLIIGGAFHLHKLSAVSSKAGRMV